ncbi:MAG: aldo/keto reductase [Alphaproteobacteria bacterium]
MKRRRLGPRGPEVSAIGLGCMGMSMAYGEPDDAESIRALHRAIDIGIDFLDTAEIYGRGVNEELLGKALKGKRGKVFLATKFGVGGKPSPDGSPQNVRWSCENSLKRLGVETIDLYYQHRMDPGVPIEDTVGALAGLIEAGKIRHIGLSEAGPETLRRAHATHKITALQSEYSLWTRNCEPEVLPACRELGIAYVAYSPLGRGFLTGTVRSLGDLPDTDRRAEHPRFQGEHLARNVELLGALETLAASKDRTPAQIAIAWVLAQGEDIIPIPGTKKTKYLEENAGAVDIVLTGDELATLDNAFPPGIAGGERYPANNMGLLQM